MDAHPTTHGMEHPVDLLDVPPLFDPGLLDRLRRAVGEESARGGVRTQGEELSAILEAASGWRDLALAARRMMLGDRGARRLFEVDLRSRLDAHGAGHLGGDHAHGPAHATTCGHAAGHAHEDGSGHGEAGATHRCVMDLAPVFDILCGISALFVGGELDSTLVRAREALHELVHRLLDLARDVSMRRRLAGGAVQLAIDETPCCDLSEPFGAWGKLDPVSFFAAATTESANNAALGAVAPESSAPPGPALLAAKAGAKFSTERPAGVEVVFFPGVTATIESWSPTEVRVAVPARGRSGPVMFGKQLGKREIDAIADRRHQLAHAFPGDFTRSLPGLRAPQTLAWPPSLRTAPSEQARTNIRVPARIVAFRAYDRQGRAVKDGEVAQGDEITLSWRVDAEGPLTEPIEVLVDGQKVHEIPVPRQSPGDHGCADPAMFPIDGDLPRTFGGTIQVAVDVRDKLVADLVVGRQRARLELSPFLRFNVNPNPMQLGWGERSPLLVIARTPVRRQTRIRARSERGQIEFLARRDGSSDVFTLEEGESIALFSVRHVGGSDVARGVAPATPDDIIHITWDSGPWRDVTGPDVPVWILRPQGRWEAPIEDALGIVGVHATVMHTGKVLYFSFSGGSLDPGFADLDRGSSQVWDPVTGAAGPVVEIGRNLFCAAQCVLPDGRVFAAGGQNAGGAAPERGEAWRWIGDIFSGAMPDTHTFDPETESWSRHADMNEGRYYPTCVLLPDGRPLVAGGLSDLIEYVVGSGNGQNDQFEVFDGGRLVERQKFRASDQYPVLFALPGTRLLFVHVKNGTYFFDLDERRFWQMPAEFFGDFGATQDFKIPAMPGVGKQTYPSQTGFVLLPLTSAGRTRIFCLGGSSSESPGGDSPAAAGAYIFELNRDHPRSSFWREARRAPRTGRILDDAVLLPDGTVLIVNGARTGHANDPSDPVFEPELFDPVAETFATMAAADPMHPRMYHSTAVLLPDGRVAVAGHTRLGNVGGLPGSADDHSIEIFNPPYLFAGPRPLFTNAPDAGRYGEEIAVETDRPGEIAKVTCVRPCAATHSTDMNQRLIVLDVVTREFDRVVVRLPADASLAPPGFYMLFLVSNLGVPSQARFLRMEE